MYKDGESCWLGGMLVRFSAVMVALVLAMGGCVQMKDPGNGTPQSSVGAHGRFPSITTKDLAGRSISLPMELPGDRTLLLIAFTREQQRDVDSWVLGLHLEEGRTPWLEIPVIDDPGAIGRWFIDSGMRRGISNHQTWKHVVTVYTHKSEFKAATGITTESSVYAMVVDRQGNILVSVAGAFSAGAAEAITQSLLLEPR